jgi:hypothetical protein
MENVQIYAQQAHVVDLCPMLHASITLYTRCSQLTVCSCLCQAYYWTDYMALWLKSGGYSITLINILPTFIDLLRAISSWLGTTLAGCFSLRGIWTFQFVGFVHLVLTSRSSSHTLSDSRLQSFLFFACLVLSVWYVPDGLKYVAFYFGGFSGMSSPILVSQFPRLAAQLPLTCHSIHGSTRHSRRTTESEDSSSPP